MKGDRFRIPQIKNDTSKDIYSHENPLTAARPDWEDTPENITYGRFHRVREFLKSRNIELSGSKILEIGSGKGVLLNLMRAAGANAVGLDINPRAGNDVLQTAGRVEYMPFADGSFDAVVSSAAFDAYVYDQNQKMMLKEIARVLRVGGVYIGFGEQYEAPIGMKVVHELPMGEASAYIVCEKEK